MTDIVKKTLDEYIEAIENADDVYKLYAAEDRMSGAVDFALAVGMVTNEEFDEYSVKIAEKVYEADKRIER